VACLVDVAVLVEARRRQRRHVVELGWCPSPGRGQSHLPLLHQLVDVSFLVVEVADVADAAGALAGASRRHSLLDAREAEDALLRDKLLGVEVDALVGTGLDAEAVAVAGLLIDEDDAVLGTLVDGLAGAGLQAGRFRAVVADALYVEVVAVGVFAGPLVLVPVRSPRGSLALGLQITLSPLPP
jgi:hypothetical protein